MTDLNSLDSVNTAPAASHPGRGRVPTFFIVGAPKCGTSSLHQALRRHPDAWLPERKDVPFFGSDLVLRMPEAPQTTDQYLAQFEPAGAARAIGESCTEYMQSRLAAKEIANAYPDARIIISLRDPVDLVYSLYNHNIWMTEEDILSFEDALEAEDERRAGTRIPRECRFVNGLFYRDAVQLADQLTRYLDAFPQEQVHVVNFDRFRADPEGVVQDVLQFLDLDYRSGLALETVNARKAPRSNRVQKLIQQPPEVLERAYHALTPRAFDGKLAALATRLNKSSKRPPSADGEVLRRLDAELRPQVDELERLLGWDLSSWCDHGHART